jgi:hypothetical protein
MQTLTRKNYSKKHFNVKQNKRVQRYKKAKKTKINIRKMRGGGEYNRTIYFSDYFFNKHFNYGEFRKTKDGPDFVFNDLLAILTKNQGYLAKHNIIVDTNQISITFNYETYIVFLYGEQRSFLIFTINTSHDYRYNTLLKVFSLEQSTTKKKWFTNTFSASIYEKQVPIDFIEGFPQNLPSVLNIVCQKTTTNNLYETFTSEIDSSKTNNSIITLEDNTIIKKEDILGYYII